MKFKRHLQFVGLLIPTALVSGCMVSPPPPAPYYAPAGPVGMAPGYVAPIAPPMGVTIVSPIGVAPGPGWGWGYHPHLGWGWHHPGYGWRHR